MTHFFIYAIAYDEEVFGIFATREEAEESRARQIAEGGPAWRDCTVERWRVDGEPEVSYRSPDGAEVRPR